MMDASVLWRRLDQPGHETARVLFRDSCWHLTGTAIFVHNREACRLDYLVVCDSGWRTISGRVARWVADQDVDIELFFDSARRWRLNGSPSTNLLPIRRLGLAVGQEAKVRAAWLRFPG